MIKQHDREVYSGMVFVAFTFISIFVFLVFGVINLIFV